MYSRLNKLISPSCSFKHFNRPAQPGNRPMHKPAVLCHQPGHFRLFSTSHHHIHLYQKLGLSPGASKTDIRQAYLRRAKIDHPDNKETGNEEKFRELKNAYDILSGKVVQNDVASDTHQSYQAEPDESYTRARRQAREKIDELMYDAISPQIKILFFILLLFVIGAIISAIDEEYERQKPVRERERRIAAQVDPLKKRIYQLLKQSGLLNTKNKAIIQSFYIKAFAYDDRFQDISSIRILEELNNSLELLYRSDILDQDNFAVIVTKTDKNTYPILHLLDYLFTNVDQLIITQSNFDIVKTPDLNSVLYNFYELVRSSAPINNEVIDAIKAINSEKLEYNLEPVYVDAIACQAKSGIFTRENWAFAKKMKYSAETVSRYLLSMHDMHLITPENDETVKAAIEYAMSKVPAIELDLNKPGFWNDIVQCIDAKMKHGESNDDIAPACVNQQRRPR